MSRTIINVQVYGAFDIPSTYVIMEAPGFVESTAIRGIINTVELENKNSDDPNDVINQLKSLGFTVCAAIDLTIGGNL